MCAVLVLAGRRADARFLLLAVGGAGVLTYVLKGILQLLGADHDDGRLSNFPSGHAAVAVAVGWSRVETGAHTALDVVGGAVLGVGWLAVCALLWAPGARKR